MSDNTDWQPIETAPTDGKESLVYTTGAGIVVMYWDDYKGEWTTGLDDGGGLEPTHWMPLPPPPQKGKRNEH